MRKETQIDVIGVAYRQFRATTTLAEKQHYLAKIQALGMDLQKELFQDTMKHIPSNVILTNGDTTAHIKSATPKVKPRARREEPKELLEGFWYDPRNKASRAETDSLPRVDRCVMSRAYAGKDNVIAMLAGAQVRARTNHYKGWSDCRICGKKNGSKEFVSGAWKWTEGLMHYITAHNVLVTDDFFDFLISKTSPKVRRTLAKANGEFTATRVRQGYMKTTYGVVID